MNPVHPAELGPRECWNGSFPNLHRDIKPMTCLYILESSTMCCSGCGS